MDASDYIFERTDLESGEVMFTCYSRTWRATIGVKWGRKDAMRPFRFVVHAAFVVPQHRRAGVSRLINREIFDQLSVIELFTGAPNDADGPEAVACMLSMGYRETEWGWLLTREAFEATCRQS